MGKVTHFTFNFAIEDEYIDKAHEDNMECLVITKEFPLDCTEEEYYDAMEEIEASGFLNTMEETYGMHGGDGEGDDLLRLGFSSYEVEKSKIDEVWEL